MFLCCLVFTIKLKEGNCSHSREHHSRVSLPGPFSADSCVVCHLNQADEGGTHPRESSEACLDRVFAQRLLFYLRALRILIYLVIVYL